MVAIVMTFLEGHSPIASHFQVRYFVHRAFPNFPLVSTDISDELGADGRSVVRHCNQDMADNKRRQLNSQDCGVNPLRRGIHRCLHRCLLEIQL